MSDRHDRHQQWAVFWCSLLGPLIYGEIPPEEAGRFLSELTEMEHLFPDGQRRKPSRATLWRKWKKYQTIRHMIPVLSPEGIRRMEP